MFLKYKNYKTSILAGVRSQKSTLGQTTKVKTSSPLSFSPVSSSDQNDQSTSISQLFQKPSVGNDVTAKEVPDNESIVTDTAKVVVDTHIAVTDSDCVTPESSFKRKLSCSNVNNAVESTAKRLFTSSPKPYSPDAPSKAFGK